MYPQFIKLLDVIKDEKSKENLIHCVFEFCESTLSRFLLKQQKKGPLPLEYQQKILKQLLQALDVLHGKMILHRDIKPDNILMDS